MSFRVYRYTILLFVLSFTLLACTATPTQEATGQPVIAQTVTSRSALTPTLLATAPLLSSPSATAVPDRATSVIQGAILPESTSCAPGGVQTVLESLRQAVISQDDAQLAALIDPEQGLRIRVSWWNPEVHIQGAESKQLFSSSSSYDWGTQDGSGNQIAGSFQDVIVPMLERDMLPASEVGCNEILHGGSAGLIQLPEEYEGTEFYSLYRPAGPEEFEMDWGTWVVGVAPWQQGYRLVYLVHYAWEI